MLALAATRFCSAARISGRRSSSADGNPGGTSGGSSCCVKSWPRTIAPGLWPSSRADLILGLLDLLLDLRDGLRGGIDQLLGLAQIEQRRDAAALPVDGQLQRFLPGGQRAPGNFQFVVQFAQMQISGGHVADQGGDHGLAVLLGAQQIRARRLRRAPQLSPDIDFERKQIERRRAQIAILRQAGTMPASGVCAVAREPVDLYGCRWRPTCGNWLERVMPRLARASSTRATASRRS